MQPKLYAYLAGVLGGEKCPTLQIGGTENHIHLLFGLSRTLSISNVAKFCKNSSSKWLKQQKTAFSRFYWQGGYAAFSVSQSRTKNVISYIKSQEMHHKTLTFEEEYRALLQRHEVNYNKEYLLD